MSTVLQGFYQSHQRDGLGRAGQQPPPAARHARPPGCRHPADERPADRAEQPRDRRRRRPVGVPQLGERGPRPGARRPVGRRPDDDPALVAADPRDADLPLRRAGVGRLPLDRRHQPGGVAARAGADAPGPGRRGRLRRRQRRPTSPRRPSSPTSCCPAALWGEKTGTFTNVDRTVHLAEQAVAPPGEARSDLDIWVDYARRMGFRDRSGRPIPRWDTPEAAFDGWRECSRGPAVRLLRHDLRPAARQRRHPVAVHRRRPGGHRADLHRPRVPHGRRLLRELRPRPAHRGLGDPGASTRRRATTAGRG